MTTIRKIDDRLLSELEEGEILTIFTSTGWLDVTIDENQCLRPQEGTAKSPWDRQIIKAQLLDRPMAIDVRT